MSEPVSPLEQSFFIGKDVSAQAPPPISTQPQVKSTLPRPKSFASHRTLSVKNSPSTGSESGSSVNHDGLLSPAASGRRVAFSSPLEGVRDDLALSPVGGGSELISPTNISRPSAALKPANTVRKTPPSALNLSARPKFGLTAPGSASFSGLAPTAGPMTAPVRPTATLPTPSIQPGFGRSSVSGALYAPGSIWTAGFKPDASSGWRSSAPVPISLIDSETAKEQNPPTSARHRGLTAAVLKDTNELIVGDVPVPRLKSVGRSDKAHEGEVPDQPPSGSPKPLLGRKPSTIILCRYYHTPGLTCTSRPCRFVHDLDAILSPTLKGKSKQDYELRSPRTANEPTNGVFASFQAQLRQQAKRLTIQDLQEGTIHPGDTVLFGNEKGDEVKGTVFLMSGGGKGPDGKSKVKFKTEPCRDFAAGYCPYGSVCSFIHDLRSYLGAHTRSDEKVPTSATFPSKKETLIDPGSRRSSELGVVSPSAAEKQGHRRPKSMDIGTSWANIVASTYKENTSATDSELVAERPRGLGQSSMMPSNSPTSSTTRLISAPEAKATTTSPSSVMEMLLQPPTPKCTASVELPTVKAKPRPLALTKSPSNPLKSVVIAAGLAAAETPSKSQQQSLQPPDSAVSLLTESDPATPWDPVLLLRRKQEEAQGADQGADHVHLQYASSTYEAPLSIQQVTRGPAGQAPSTYPWSMPVTPPILPNAPQTMTQYPGGPAVMWTPAGWAVQDAAMALALRTSAREALGQHVKPRKPKSYFRTKPCKYFAEGFCPHGEDCTFQHPPDLSPGTSATSDSDQLPASPSYAEAASSRHLRHRSVPCKFFNSLAGCSNGDACAFLHVHVLPAEALMVTSPKPWRTRPCRHFQLGRCVFGDACHFAHVVDPQWIASGKVSNHESPARRESTVSIGSTLTEDKLQQMVRDRLQMDRHFATQGDQGESSDEEDFEVVTNETTRAA